MTDCFLKGSAFGKPGGQVENGLGVRLAPDLRSLLANCPPTSVGLDMHEGKEHIVGLREQWRALLRVLAIGSIMNIASEAGA